MPGRGYTFRCLGRLLLLYERLVVYDTRNDTRTPLPDSRMHIRPRIDGEVVVAVVGGQGEAEQDQPVMRWLGTHWLSYTDAAGLSQ